MLNVPSWTTDSLTFCSSADQCWCLCDPDEKMHECIFSFACALLWQQAAPSLASPSNSQPSARWLWKTVNEHTQKLQEITFVFVFFSCFFFPKGRSRVWLMSRLSWTGWLASKTPRFQLTTYRQQRTKCEGNKNSCIVHCVNTLEKIYVHVRLKKKRKEKLTKFLRPLSVSTHSGFTEWVSDAIKCFGEMGKREITVIGLLRD